MNYAQKKKVIVAGLLLACMLIAAACSTDSSTSSTTPTNQQAKATLSHVATGTADVTWSAANQSLTVKVSASGLAPNSKHPEHIHKGGDCNSNGSILYTLDPLQADATGVATSQTTITSDQGAKAIPASGWYINIHDGGDGLTPIVQGEAIACGNIINPSPSATTDQTVHLTFGPTPDPNQAVAGNSQLSLANGKLTVTLTLSGLAPNSTHIAHIHKGTCAVQGAVKFPLTNVIADANGNGTSTTTINGVDSIPLGSWYVNVHFAGTAADAATQTGDDPISCGDVVAA